MYPPLGMAAPKKKQATRKVPVAGRLRAPESGMVRKTLWLHADEAEALREKAYQERRAESEIVREALRALLKIED